MSYIAEYIWIDGSEPTAKLRSKARVFADGEEPAIWGFDGSSTNQATGEASDVVLLAGWPSSVRLRIGQCPKDRLQPD